MGVGLAAICSLGMHSNTSSHALSRLRCSLYLLANPYKNLLRFINPDALLVPLTGKPVIDTTSYCSLKSIICRPTFNENPQEKGFIAHSVTNYVRRKAKSYANSDNIFVKHVVSRFTYGVVLTIASIISRLADGILAIPLVTLSLVTDGKFQKLNNAAYRTLKVTGIVHDIMYCALKCINPWV